MCRAAAGQNEPPLGVDIFRGAESHLALESVHGSVRRAYSVRHQYDGGCSVNATPTTSDVGPKLASPFLDLLPISGVAISVMNHQQATSVIHASDATARRLEEIHFNLGEGPIFDCFAEVRPVLVPDIAAADRWPSFCSDAIEADAAAVFVFPLSLGAACIGTVLCYRETAGDLDAAAVDVGSSLSRAAAGPAFRRAIAMANDETPDREAPVETRREVHQATGMVSIQLDSTATDAFARMRAYAFSHGIDLRDVASDVLTRQLDFSASKDETA